MFPRPADTPLPARPRRRAAALLTAALVVAGLPVGSGRARTAPDVGIPTFAYAHPARTMPPALPAEAVLFTVASGRVVRPLTLRQLKSLPAVRYRTTHMQLRQAYTYEGVALRDLAALGGFTGRDVRVFAANGFSATILASDYMYHPIMLAYTADARPIPILKKGPLTVVLPGRPERFHAGTYSAAWVWFAERLEPVP